MQLTRADIGSGRVVIDDAGVTRRGLLRARSLAWEAIHDYRLTIHLMSVDSWAARSLDIVDGLAELANVVRGARGESRIVYAIELRGDGGRRVAFDAMRSRHAEAGIFEILRRLRERLDERARTQLKIRGRASFGPLDLAPHALQWGTHPPLARDAVEAVELFDASPARLRVMARGKVFPYGQARTGHVPNVVTALEIAEELGYRVRGKQLIAALVP